MIPHTPKWDQYCRNHARTAVMPIRARIERQTEKALLLDTGLRQAWVPKRLVSHDEEAGVFRVPAWLAEEKRLT